MTNAEWEKRVKAYEKNIREIRISRSVEPATIKEIVELIDKVNTELYFDMSAILYEFESASAMLKTAEAEFYMEAKENVPEGAKSPPSDEKAKAIAKTRVKDEGFLESKLEVERKKIFLESIETLMSEKRQLLGVLIGVSKLN